MPAIDHGWVGKCAYAHIGTTRLVLIYRIGTASIAVDEGQVKYLCLTGSDSGQGAGGRSIAVAVRSRGLRGGRVLGRAEHRLVPPAV
jgi:hypothetical protein